MASLASRAASCYKVAYATGAAAHKALSQIRATNRDHGERVYRCPECSFWHLGKRH